MKNQTHQSNTTINIGHSNMKTRPNEARVAELPWTLEWEMGTERRAENNRIKNQEDINYCIIFSYFHEFAQLSRGVYKNKEEEKG